MDDNEIIELFFARNEEAIRQTDSAYGKRLFHLSDNILHSQEDAEESVNDTYLKAWNAIPPTLPKSLFAYLAKVCRNVSLSRLNWENAVKRKAEVVCLTDEMESCIPDAKRDAEGNGKELGRIINAFLETLSTENKILFVRRYWYAETTVEIAARFGMNENTLVSRLSRIRMKLAKYLEEEDFNV